MRSNERRLQYPQYAALRVALAVALLSGTLGCRQQAAGDAPAAQTPAPAAMDKSAAVANGENVPPPPALNEAAKPGASALVGRTMPPYPDGLTDAQGVCVAGGEGLEHVCDFGIGVLGRDNGDQTVSSLYLVAKRNTDREAKQPEWQVTDAIDLPAIKENYDLQLDSCRVDGELRGGIVAIVRHSEDQEYSADVLWKKQYDVASGKFVEVGPGRVDCIHPGYGL
jgi:hypothetical protein